MSETYLFFNSTDNDRRYYSAEDFASVFATVISDGLIHKDGKPNLKVKRGNGLVSIIESGKAFIKGHPYFQHEDIQLIHDKSDENFDRLDRIVLRFDNRTEARYIKLFILKGIPSTSPKTPALTRTNEVFELSLAQVRIKANSLQLADIIDERLNKDVCGLADSLMTIPLDKLETNFNEFKNQLLVQYNALLGSLGGEADPIKFKRDLMLTKLNHADLLIERDLENKTVSMDDGYFFDSLKDTSKVDLVKSNAVIDTELKQIKLDGQSLEGDVYWQPHAINFVSNKVTHLHTRPVNTLALVTSDALAGQDKITLANYKITITEVNN